MIHCIGIGMNSLVHRCTYTLCRQIESPDPHRDFLESGREGMHHVQFRVDDCDGWVKKLNDAGYETVWYDRLRPDIAYAYMERPGDPLLVEFLE